MTPEERAKDWFTLPPKYRTKQRLAVEVRDAENEALERAAKMLDNGTCLHSEATTVGAMIRALKHSESRELIALEQE